jgi:hypothetical protein
MLDLNLKQKPNKDQTSKNDVLKLKPRVAPDIMAFLSSTFSFLNI